MTLNKVKITILLILIIVLIYNAYNSQLVAYYNYLYDEELPKVRVGKVKVNKKKKSKKKSKMNGIIRTAGKKKIKGNQKKRVRFKL